MPSALPCCTLPHLHFHTTSCLGIWVESLAGNLMFWWTGRASKVKPTTSVWPLVTLSLAWQHSYIKICQFHWCRGQSAKCSSSVVQSISKPQTEFSVLQVLMTVSTLETWHNSYFSNIWKLGGKEQCNEVQSMGRKNGTLQNFVDSWKGQFKKRAREHSATTCPLLSLVLPGQQN